MSVIRWEDPPVPNKAGRRPSRYWIAIADDLKADPRRWAVIYQGARNGALADRVKKGQSAFAPAGAFEAAERVEDGIYRVYARYLGEGQ